MNPEFKTFTEKDFPPVIGHYSHVALLPSGIIYLSGQKAWKDNSGTLIDGGISEQTSAIFKNIQNILQKLECDLGSLIRISCHLSNIDDYDEFNKAYAGALNFHRPVRTVLGGYKLRGGALVELVAEAFRR